MRKSLSRNLYLISLGIVVLGIILLFVSLIGSTSYTNPDGTTAGSIGNPVLFSISVFLMIAAAIPATVAWIGALIKMAQLSRWGWFVCLILFSGITMLIYIFAGPETPPVSMQTAQMMPPPYQPMPPQQYGQMPQQQYGPTQYGQTPPQYGQMPPQQYEQNPQQYEQRPPQQYGQTPPPPPQQY